jgi:hypothetical protein
MDGYLPYLLEDGSGSLVDYFQGRNFKAEVLDPLHTRDDLRKETLGAHV